MNRRRFLGALASGVAFAALPRRLRAAHAPGAPRRLILIMQNNGTQQGGFWPTADGFTSPILEPLLSNPRIAQRTLVVRGVSIPRDANNTDANEHDMGFARMWTGERLIKVAGHPWAGGPSVDQIVARTSGRPSLNLAVYASQALPYPKPGFQHRRSFSYVAAGVHKLPVLDPLVAYTNLFWTGGTALLPEVRRRLAARQSALDAAQAGLQELQARLGPTERAKLERHAEAVRLVETRLSDQLAGRPGPGATCRAKPPEPRDYRNSAPQLLVNDESAIPDLVRAHFDLIVAAMACDLTRVATFQFGFSGGRWRFDWIGVSHDHHDLAHQDKSDAGVDPDVTEKVIRLNRWYASQIAALAAGLDAIPEGGGTLLDQTLIVWANEFGRGDHSQKNVPIVFIGGAGGGMPAGGRLVDAGEQPFQRVGATALQAMGLPVAGFGDLPDCGRLLGM